MSLVHIYQILNHYTPREDLDAGFGFLPPRFRPRLIARLDSKATLDGLVWTL